MTKEQLLALADEYATLTADTAAVTKARAALSDALDAVVRDAELWRAYKARKDAVIAAGMGRNPLREETK